jgi:hypothetical protein
MASAFLSVPHAARCPAWLPQSRQRRSGEGNSRDVLLRPRASQLVPRSLSLDLIEQPAHRVLQVFHRQRLRNPYRDERRLRWSILIRPQNPAVVCLLLSGARDPEEHTYMEAQAIRLKDDDVRLDIEAAIAAA